jgi:hypothetical protein
MKHLEDTFETYVYSHYKMCNIPIYFCNIDIQRLQHISETFETYSFNMWFSPSFCTTQNRVREWSLSASRMDGDGDAAWQWPAVLAPGLGPASDDHLSWPLATRSA